MGYDDKRVRIFDKYARNLEHIASRLNLRLISASDNVSVLQDVYICPLCNRAFSVEMALEENGPRLTLEHIIPKKLGSHKTKILTCAECNSGQGSGSDIDLIKAMEFARLSLNGVVPAEIMIDGVSRFRGELRKEGKEVKIIINASTNFMDKFKGNFKGGNIKIKYPNNAQLRYPYLKIAYLLMFEQFGYSILLEANLARIREQIQNKTWTLPHACRLEGGFDLQDGIYIVTKPIQMRAYLVVYTVQVKNHSKQVTVVMPGPYPTGWENFSRYSEIDNSLFCFEKATFDLTEATCLTYFEDWNDIQ